MARPRSPFTTRPPGTSVRNCSASPGWRKATKQLQEKLAKPVSLDGYGPNNTPLGDVLEDLAARFSVTVIVDHSEFKKGDQFVRIEDSAIRLPPQKDVKRQDIFARVLAQARASFEVVDGAIIVVAEKKGAAR